MVWRQFVSAPICFTLVSYTTHTVANRPFTQIIFPLWHVYSIANDAFNLRDGIRYSYISFCTKSVSISLVNFSVDIVAAKKTFVVKI